MAVSCSAGDCTSAFEFDLASLPRLAGVTSPRQRWFGARTLESREIDPGFWHEGCQSCNEIHQIEGHLGRSVSVEPMPISI